jgi:hypothetical protein
MMRTLNVAAALVLLTTTANAASLRGADNNKGECWAVGWLVARVFFSFGRRSFSSILPLVGTTPVAGSPFGVEYMPWGVCVCGGV